MADASVNFSALVSAASIVRGGGREVDMVGDIRYISNATIGSGEVSRGYG